MGKMDDNYFKDKKKSKWTKVLKEDFERLLESKSYAIKEDGTIKVEGWHIDLGTVVELDIFSLVIYTFS